jgi:cellulose synthase/poly-beta-1,6-N-acetylglucosamine synthase-like glycosyltransferase
MWIFILFCIITTIQITYYLLLFGKFSFSKIRNKNVGLLPVSVIICAKNEASNLKKNLPYLADQEYSEFEIVLVNDNSSDKSLEIMKNFQKEISAVNKSVKVITIDKENAKGKKNALSIGIRASKFDHLLLTDADCKPISKNWIRQMSSCFSSEKSIILGYGPYRKIEYSVLNKIIRFETLFTAIQYFSYSITGMPYMGVGRNIAYKKKDFIEAKGFESHSEIISGDDDLFINEIANSQNTEICFSKDSFTVSEPKTNFKAWIHQKRRHITTASHYKKTHKLLLGLFYISQFLFWFLAVILLFLNYNLIFVNLLIIIRFLVWYPVIVRSANKLDEKDLIRYAPIYEISIIFIQLYIFFKNKIAPPNHW